MKQDFIVGLYQSVGMPAGAEFSSEDVSLLYSKVFHVPSNISEAQMAIKKIAGGDNSWSCVGENVVDVLLEMEREREKKEQLYWDLQVLSVGNPNNFFVMDKPVNTDPHDLNCLHQSTNPNTFKTDSGSLQSCITNTDSSQMGRLVGEKELYRSVKRLKKATRKCWARLASEGVQSIFPSPLRGKKLGVKVQAWGCVSLSDVLLLVEVKYDVVTHLLYTEMLQEHYTPRVWGALAPWQQHKEHEELEDLAEEVLASGDMLRLAELPGALRIYRVFLGASFRYSPESREQSWSAVSLLCELHTSRQQERETLTVLGKRLDMDSMRLLFLHIRLATLRAQREKMSHTALLAARQSWETWPQINNPCRVEQAALWLQGEEEEQNEDVISVSLQQYSVLHLLVLSQEQERKHLVKLVHEVSLEDLQGAACTVPPKEESNKQAALKNVCIKRLRQIHASLQTHETQTPLEQANLHIQVQSETQLQMQPHMISNPAMWFQHQLEDCALLLLTHLLELQEVQASALLPELMDMSVQHLQVLQAKYDSELQAQCYTNLLQILMPDGPPLTTGSIPSPCPNLIDNSSDEQMTTQSCCTGPAESQNRSDGPAEALTSRSVTRQAADGTIKRDVCTDCGATMEELPYLEIRCVSNEKSNTHQSIAIEKGAQEEEEGSTSAKSYEKQGSLITLAWSKPPGGDTDNDVESGDVGTGQSLDSESSMNTRVQSSDMSSTAGDLQCDETSGESHDEECVFTGHRDVQSADQQCNSETQLTLGDRSMVDQPQKGEAMSEHNLQTHSLQAALPHPSVDPPEIKPYTDDICSGLSSETSDDGRVGVGVETCSTVIQSEKWDLRGPDASDAEDQKYNSQINFHSADSVLKADCELAERGPLRENMLMETEQVREPISAIERERTMRSLVDMQKKVEQRQQRDRERQLLRVQERLSIIQNRKGEEDLLGLKHKDRLKHLTHDLPQEDKNKQKTVVRERLEQLRRERSYVMQSKRDRNTAGFKELLGPLTLHSRETEDGTD